MGLTKYNIGALIEQTYEPNTELIYGEEDVRGITITKEIIPTRADVSGNDLSKFLIVHPNEFIYNPRTHGKHIGLGYNNSNENFLISWNNTSFRIKDEAIVVIVPEYLFLHFNRNEWDREACFRSWGSSTEVFSWDALCDMKLELPPIEIQQKYVDIYNAMLANQKAYETGLDDLKLVCDGYIEELKHRLPGTKIGKYIIQSDTRNDQNLDVSCVRGLSIAKEIISTKADMTGVSLSNYKVLPPESIAYVTVTSRNGEKITIALNDSTETYIVSSSYIVFSTDANKLLPEYLMMFFNRGEFDRYARFNSWGSARETFDWSEMCDVQIPIPEIVVQKSISDIYKVYKKRQAINEKLKAQIKALCPILIRGSHDEAIKEVAVV